MSENGLPERHGMRPAQVLAAALAAITAAFLGSRLGVYGTVIGAGVLSLVTTVGGEFYLRSLERTKQAAKRTKEVALARTLRASPVSGDADDAAVSDAAEVDGSAAEVEGAPPARRVRWPVLAGGTMVAFVLGMAAITGIEALTGSSLSGERGGTVSNVLGGSPGPVPAEAPEPAEQEKPSTAPSSSQPPSSSSRPTSSVPTTTKSTAPAEPSESTGPTQPPAQTTTEPEPSQEPTGPPPPPW